MLLLSFLFGTIATLSAQRVSTNAGIGTRAQLLRNLDALESTHEVIDARAAEAEKGNQNLNTGIYQLPDSAQLTIQINRALGNICLPFNSKIGEYIQIFADSKRRNTEAMLGMASLFVPAIEHRLKEQNLPLQLAMLPAVLSAFNQQAVAADGRSGLWQLNYQVAIHYGLVCDAEVDERRDPYKSTAAAISYLKDLYAIYQDWPLSLAAYTAGPTGVNRARNRVGKTANFGQIYGFLAANDREDLWAFAAAAYIMSQAKDIGLAALPMGDLPLLDRVQLQAPLKFAHVADVLGIPEKELRQLNPVCRTEIIPGINLPVQLCLPQGYGERFTLLKDSIYKVQARQLASSPETAPNNAKVINPEIDNTSASKEIKPKPIEKVEVPELPYSPPAGYSKLEYTIQPGDNLGLIARWYGMNLSELKAQNNLKSDRINAGDKLDVYVPKSEATALSKVNSLSFEEKQAMVDAPVKPKELVVGPTKPIEKPKTNSAEGYSIYTVKSGDNLWAISQKYPGVSADDIMKFNGIGEALQPGMKLKIPKAK